MIGLTHSLALLASAVAVAAGPAPGPSHGPRLEAARQACRHVRIGGHRVCLAPDRYCTRQWEHTYRRYGYTCSHLDSNDRYHLRRLRTR